MRLSRLHRILLAYAAVIVPVLSISACNTLQQEQAAQPTTTPHADQATTESPATSAPAAPATEPAPSTDVSVSAPSILISGKSRTSAQVMGSESPRNDGIHDSSIAAIEMLQNPQDAMKAFPRDRRQQVDWGKALEQGLIAPRVDLLGTKQMTVMDMDILMKNTQSMPWVKFPHKAHTQWLDCGNCHPAIFEMKQGANPITMNKVLSGEYCGVCHDSVAFSLFSCERCHSVPHEGSGEKWW